MKHSTKYLYNLNPKVLINMPYKEAIELKITSAKKLLNTLYLPHFMLRRDTKISAVGRALNHNIALLEELKC